MSERNKNGIFCFYAVTGLAVGLFVCSIHSSAWAEQGAKSFPWDVGPTEIDVSKYPKEQQENYKLFERRCQRCHTLARPINAPFTGEELAAYVQKMMKKPRSGIDSKTAEKITGFLKYDTKVRKRERFWEKSK